MKIIFEYENGLQDIVHHLKAYKIDERTSDHTILDTLLSNPGVKRMYIIADDNGLV